MSRAEAERLLRESYTELCAVTKRATAIEREAEQLRVNAAHLALKIHLVIGGLGDPTAPPFDAAEPATHAYGKPIR